MRLLRTHKDFELHEVFCGGGRDKVACGTKTMDSSAIDAGQYCSQSIVVVEFAKFLSRTIQVSSYRKYLVEMASGLKKTSSETAKYA